LRTHSNTPITQNTKYTLKRLVEEAIEVANSKEPVKRDKKGNIKYVLIQEGKSYIL
jgi:hypothetical protein